MTGVSDGTGKTHTLAYNAGGQLISVIDGLGRSLTMSYDIAGKLTQVSDGVRAVGFSYTVDDLTSYTDALGKITNYIYSAGGLMTSMTLPGGNAPYAQTFAPDGKVTTQTDAIGNTFTFAYNSATSNTTITGSLGTTRVHDNTNGALASSTDQLGNSITMGSDADGRRNSVTGKLGNTTTITYNAGSGKPESGTYPDNTTLPHTYTARTSGRITFHDVTANTFPDGTSESYGYDATSQIMCYRYPAIPRPQFKTNTPPLVGFAFVFGQNYSCRTFQIIRDNLSQIM